MRISPETGRYVYQVGAVHDWLRAEGRAFIAQHQAAIAGKTVVPSKRQRQRRRQAAPATDEGAAP